MKNFIIHSIKLKKILLTSSSILLLISIWTIVAIKINKEYLIPYPSSVIKSLYNIITDNNFISIVFTTLSNCLLSFSISFILAICLAIISYFSPTFENLFKPIINILKAIPTISIILVSLIYLSSNKSPILVGTVILTPIMYASFSTSLKQVDQKLIELSKLYKVSLIDTILKLYIPSILEPLFSQSKSCLSLSVKLTIAAEVLAHTMNSIGIQMQIAKTFIEMDVIFAWTIIAILLSLILEGILTIVLIFIKRRKNHGYTTEKRV